MSVRDDNWLPGGLRREGRIPRAWGGRGREDYTPQQSGPVLGLIVAKYAKDDEQNKYRMFTEYDVYYIEQHIVLRRLPVMSVLNGLDNCAEITLTASGDIPELTDPESTWQRIMDSEGDLVAVSWLDGTYPVIMGVMNHLKAGGDGAPLHSVESQQPWARVRYNTVDVNVTKDGELNVYVDDGKEINLIINGKSAIKIYNDVSGVRVDLGDTAIDFALLGTAFKTWWDANVPGHTHGGGTSDLPAALPASVLSDKVRIDK